MGHLIDHSCTRCTTSGLGYAAARMLATKGYRQVIVTGAAWPGSSKRPLNSRLRPKNRSSRRWNSSGLAVQRSVRLAGWSSKVSRSISCCSMPGWSLARRA